MKALLLAVKQALQTELAGDVRSVDIFISPDENYLPNGCKFPCIGIKDGGITRRENVGGTSFDTTRQVLVIPFVQLAKPEASIVGDTASSAKGLLDVAADILDALDDNLLDGAQSATCLSESPSRLLGGETELVQAKTMMFEYELEESR